MLHQPECLGPRAYLLGDAVQFIIEDIAEALGENERKDVVLELGASLAPRMEQAASQIHDSRDLSESFVCITNQHSQIVYYRSKTKEANLVGALFNRSVKDALPAHCEAAPREAYEG
jgi:hypothetical protein